SIDRLNGRLDELAADRSKPPKKLTREEVAELYGVSASTVSNWVSAGKIPHHKAGGAVVFFLNELLDWSRRRPAK
ncbi:MAG TPA: helix-turn-helix domain-containing protein, partial [Blastocatellia bacterium]